ncbi:MAG: ABC transporter ATP-binding protein [Muribaculaceae bacterium]|nr:ABC transporter ATP-binding protein [Muribaculaceae bacterium]
MVTLDNVSYRYMKQGPSALTDVTLQLEPGIHLLLGENGAGKTTLLHLMAGLLTAREGVCMTAGMDMALRQPAAQSKVFFLPDSLDVPFQTIGSMADLHGRFYPRFDRVLLERNLDRFGLKADTRIKQMSFGTRRKALIAYALALRTEVLLLDEPTNGLDIESKKTLRRMIAESAVEDSTVVVSTHSVHDLESIYDGVVILRKGHVQLASTTARLAGALAFVSHFEPVEGAIYQETEAGIYRAILPGGDDEETAVNFSLLYTAMSTPAAEIIVNLLWKSRDENKDK